MDPLRRFIHFETTPDGGGGESGGGEPPAPDGGGDESGGGDAAALSPEAIEALSGLAGVAPTLTSLAEMYQQQIGENEGEQNEYAPPQQYGAPQQYGPPQPQGQELQFPDPTMDPEGFARFMADRDAALMDQVQQRFHPVVDYYAQQSAHQQIDQGLAALPEDVRINSLLPEDYEQEKVNEALQRQASAYVDYGQMAVPEALQSASSELRGLLAAAGEHAVAQFKAGLQGGNQNGEVREPGIAGAGVEAVTLPNDYDSIVDDYARGNL